MRFGGPLISQNQRAAIALFACLVVWLSYIDASPGPPNQESTKTQSQSKPEQRGTNQPAAAVKIEQPEQDQEKSSGSGPNGPQKGGNRRFVGWRLSDKIAAVAIVVGALQFFALAATVWATRKSAERQLRAYVHIENVRISQMNSGNNPQIEVFVRNYGQTPARRITNTYYCCAFNEPRERGFARMLAGVKPVELPDLAPQAQVISNTNYFYNLWASVKPFLLRRQSAFYVFGRIDYYDVFEQLRTTEFRYKLMIGSVSGIPDDENLVIDSRAGNRTT
jgi:hypothetical protein